MVLINLGFVLTFELYGLQVGADRLAEETVGGEDGSSIVKRNNSQQRSLGSVPKNSEYKPKLGSRNRQEWHSHGGKDGFANIVRSQQGINSPECRQ